MKNQFTLLFLCLYLSIFSQEMRLDSIIFEHPTVSNFDDKLIFEYTDGQLSRYTYNQKLSYDIRYDESGNYNEVIVDFDINDEIAVDENWEFGYSLGKLTGVVINLVYGDFVSVDFTHDNGNIQSSLTTIEIGGYTQPHRRKEYSYPENDILIKEFNIENNPETLIFAKLEEYDDNDLLSKIHYGTNNDLLDSFVYVDNGLTAKYRISSSMSELIDTYETDNTIDYNNISNPSDFFDLLYLVAPSDFNSYEHFDLKFAYPMKNSTRVLNLSEHTWHYSVLTSTKNERVTAVPLSVFPNPTTEAIRIETDRKMETFEIYNMNGALVRKGFVDDNSIRVSSLPQGQYTIVCVDKDDAYCFAQFIKN